MGEAGLGQRKARREACRRPWGAYRRNLERWGPGNSKCYCEWEWEVERWRSPFPVLQWLEIPSEEGCRNFLPCAGLPKPLDEKRSTSKVA